MKTKNSILMKQAREVLSGKWGFAIGTFLVSNLIILAARFIPDAGLVIYFLIGGAMSLGATIFSLSLSRNQNPKFEQIFEGFKKYGLSLRVFPLMVLYIFLWTLLFIVPGIIAALSYSMVFYIIADNDSVTKAKEALEMSKKMMYGHKWKLFCLWLRFIGWALLSILTLGIGFLWLAPYVSVSLTKFYDDIKVAPSATQG